MWWPIEIAQFACLGDADALRAGFVLTIAALAVIVRQPRKNQKRNEEK
jgi:hypothetical protein